MSLFLIAIIGFLAWFAFEKSRRKTHPVAPGHHPEITLPYTQEFELYHNALSLCSMKSRVCMAELQLPYESHHVDLIETGAYENIRAPFLALNPGGTVPVLVHEGHPVYESHEQIRYAAAHAPAGSPLLVPDDAAARAEMEQWIDRSSITGNPMENGHVSAGNAVPGLTVPIFAAMIDQIPYWKILEGLLFHFDKIRPVVFVAFKLRGLEKLAKLAPAMKALARSQRQMGTHLDALDEQLQKTGGPYILGETFSLADVSWLVIFERLRQVDSLHVFMGDGRRSACEAYWNALTSRPSYREAILEHSHPTIDYGTKRLQDAKSAVPELKAVLEPENA